MAHIRTYARIKPNRVSQGNYCCTDEVLQVKVSGPLRDTYNDRSGFQFHSGKATTNHNFKFAHVFQENASQAEVFKIASQDVVEGFLDGYNGTIFAYGQTGSGKTYTMEGSARTYEERGLAPRALSLIYKALESRKGEDISIYVSCMEIYQEVGYDLLNPTVRTNSVVTSFPKVAVVEGVNGSCLVRNLSTHLAANENIAQNLLLHSEANRRVAETPLNKRSSRSHAIFTIQLASRKHNSDVIVRSKLHLVDLAGSERVAKSGISGRTLTEAKFINLSLHYLEGVIIALQHDTNGVSRPKSPGPSMVNGWVGGLRPGSATSNGNREVHAGKYVPYRNSLLTMVLRDSLGGNCQTAMIAAMSLETHNLSETLSTCRFAQRVACIKNIVRKNEEVDDKSMIRRLRRRVAELEMQISLLQSGNNQCSNTQNGNSTLDIRLTSEEKVECAKIMQGYLSGRIKDPILAGAHTVARLRECLRILKVVILEHYSRQNTLRQPTGQVGPMPTGIASRRPTITTQETETTNVEIPTVILDRSGTNQAVLQNCGRRVSSAKSTQSTNVPASIGAREWKFRINQTVATATSARPVSSIDKPTVLRADGESDTSDNNSKSMTAQRPDSQTRSTDRQATPMKEAYKSPYEHKKENMIRKLDSKLTKAKANMQEQQLHLVQAQHIIKLQQLRLIHSEIAAKVEETKKLVAEQRVKTQDFSAHEVHSELAQQERLVERHLFKRQVKMEKRLQMVADEIRSLKVKMEDSSHSADDARKMKESTPSATKLEEKYPQFVSRTGRVNTTHVLDILQSEDKQCEKANMEKQCVATLSQQIHVKELATRQKLLAFKEKLRQAKLGNVAAAFTKRAHPMMPWHQSMQATPENNSTDVPENVHTKQHKSSNDDNHLPCNYPDTFNHQQSSISSGENVASSEGEVTGKLPQNCNRGTVVKLNSRCAKDDSAVTQKRVSTEYDAPETSVNSTGGGVSFLQKYSHSRPGSAASSQLMEQWAQNSVSKVDSSKRWDDAYSNDSRNHAPKDPSENVDKTAFRAPNHPQCSSSPINEPVYDELPMTSTKDRSAVNGDCVSSWAGHLVKSHTRRNTDNAFTVGSLRQKQVSNDNDITGITNGPRGNHTMSAVASNNVSSWNAKYRHGDNVNHVGTNESGFEKASSFFGSRCEQNDARMATTGSQVNTFESALQNMLGTEAGNKSVTISHEQYDKFARHTKPPVLRKGRVAGKHGRDKVYQSGSASRVIRRDGFSATAPKQSYASNLTWRPKAKETTVSEKVTAYLQDLSLFSSAGGIVNTQHHSYDDTDLVERRKPRVVEDETTDGPSGVWKRHLAAGKPKPDIEVDNFVPRIKAIHDDEREVTYMNTAREQKQRIARIRKSKMAAEVIQRSWRSHCTQKRKATGK